jgi:hypothetical protein
VSDYYAKTVTPTLTIEQELMLKEPSDERLISNFMQNVYSTTVGIRKCDQHTKGGASSINNAEIDDSNELLSNFGDDNDPQYLDEYFVEESINGRVKMIDNFPGKTLNINSNLQPKQQQKLQKLL